MAAMTPEQIGASARRAGFTGEGLKTIIAIALAESGGDPSVVSKPNKDSRRTVDRGLVQLNSYWQRAVSDSCALNPDCAMVEAFRISGGGVNFGAWTTYKRGTYRNMWDRAEQGAAANSGALVGGGFGESWQPSSGIDIPGLDDVLGAIPGLGAAGDVAAGIGPAFQAVGAVFRTLLDQDLYLRGMKIAAGVLIVGGGLYVIFRDPVDKGVSIGKKITGAVAGAATGGPTGAAVGAAVA